VLPHIVAAAVSEFGKRSGGPVRFAVLPMEQDSTDPTLCRAAHHVNNYHYVIYF